MFFANIIYIITWYKSPIGMISIVFMFYIFWTANYDSRVL